MITRWDLLCSAKQRGWAGTLPSWNLLEEVNARPEDCVKIGQSRMPIISLLPFCHEITHHLIFDTAVGAALAGLQTQARARAAKYNRSGFADPRTELAIIDFQLRYQTLSDAFKPLIEGLALFAELDGKCGLADRPSVRMQWTARLFVDSAAALYEPSAEEVHPIVDKFVTARMSIIKKEALLSQPLSCTKDGVVEGDLAGYLTVKGLFAESIQRTRFVDADLFISHLIDHFFEDSHLVKLLTPPVSKTLDDAIDLSGQIFEDVAFGIGKCLDSYPRPGDRRTRPKTNSQRKFVPHERELMCIARFPADVEQQGDRIDVYTEGKLWGTFPAHGLPQERKGQATIEFFISPRERYEAYTVTLSSDVVAIVVNSPESGFEIAQRLAMLLPNRETARKQANEESAALSALQKRMPKAGILAAMCDENLQRIERLFTGMVLAAVRKNRVDSVRASMRHNGFLGLFNNDRDLLQQYAALSNFAGLLPSRKFVEDLARDVGLDLDKTLVDLRACSERTGMKLFEAVGDMIFTYA